MTACVFTAAPKSSPLAGMPPDHARLGGHGQQVADLLFGRHGGDALRHADAEV
jgi:hypothetical protein